MPCVGPRNMTMPLDADDNDDRPGVPADGPPVAWLVAAATAAAAAVRLAAAWGNPGACYDAYLYAGYAEYLAAGEYEPAFSYLNLNLFVAFEAAAIGLGFDPISAARSLSLIAAVATILPLYGLVRRLYDARIAVAACWLYALQPPLAKLAVEPIRDPPFLFLFVLALWAVARLSERPTLARAAWAGLATTAAIHVRSEGWALLIPLAGWPAAACWHARRHAGLAGFTLRRVGGVAAAVAVLPVAIVAVNVTLLRGHDRWEVGRLAPLTVGLGIDLDKKAPTADRPAETPAPAMPSPAVTARTVAAVATTRTETTRAETTTDVAPPPSAPPAACRVDLESRPHSPDQGRRPFAHVYTIDVANAFHPLMTALILIGTVRFVGRLRRPECLVLVVAIAFLFAAVGLRLARFGEINGRYFLPAFFLAIGAGGEGLVWLADVVRRRLRGTPWPAIGAAAVVLSAGGLVADIVLWRDRDRANAIALAESTAATLPRPIRLGCSPTAGRLANHLARAAHAADRVSLPRAMTFLVHEPPAAEAVRREANAVLVETYHAPHGVARCFLEQLAAAGYRPHPLPDAPFADRYVLMLAPPADESPAVVAARPGRGVH